MLKRCYTIFIASCLFLSIFSSTIPTSIAATEKIDSDYYQSVMNSSKKQTLIIELFEEATVPYSEHNQTSLLSNSNNTTITLDDNYAENLELFQLSVFNSISSTVPISLIHTYQYVYNGIAVETAGYNIRYLLKNENIKRIHAITHEEYPERSIATSTIHAQEVWEKKSKSNNLLTGKNTKVGIIDSGIDYNHIDFTPTGVGPDSRVKAGYDFVDGTNDCKDSGFGGNMPPHGTHVAGITSGKNPDDNTKIGVAPDSDLYVYKVFSKKGGGANPAYIIKAADQSVKDGCDVINLSLGHGGASESNDSGNPYYDALANADKAGTMVVAAAGNAGTRHKKNPWPIDAPGTFDFALQVSASDDRLHQSFAFNPIEQDPIRINAYRARYSPPFPTGENCSEYQLIDCGYGDSNEFPSEVKGNIAFISRGPKNKGLSFQLKNLNAKKAGAIGCIIYNYDPDPFGGILVNTRDGERPEDFEFIPCIFVSGVSANTIKPLLDSNYTIDFPVLSNVVFSDFSSTGPSYSVDENILKPEICAPGKQINSAVLNDKYEDWDGTSMATPFVVGCVALIKQAHPTWSPQQIKRIIMHSSDPLVNYVNNQYTSWFLQGSGQINVDNAVSSPIEINPPYIMRNVEQFDKPVSITIKNIIDKEVKLSFSSEIFKSVIETINNPMFEGIEEPATLTLSDNNITLKPGETKKVTLTISETSDAFINRKYEGALWVNILNSKQVNSSSNQHHLPLILWKDTLSEIETSISNFFFTQDVLDIAANENGYVYFKLNAGSILEIDIGSPQDSINFQNMASQLTIHAYDKTGIDWGVVKTFEYLPLGEYAFKWDGKTLEGEEFLPDGDFHLAAMIKGMVYDGAQNDVWETILSDTSIKIEGSSIPQPPSFFISSPKKLNVGDKFVMDIGFRDPQNITEFELELKFSRSKLDPGEFQLGDFVDPVYQEEDGEVEFEKGTFYLKGQKNPDWDGRGNAVIAQIEFEAKRKEDNLEIDILDFKFEDEEGNDRKTIFFLPSIAIENEGATLGDFNEDGVVNDLDFERLKEHLGLNWNDEKWVPVYDLNSDFRINLGDLLLFSKYYTPGT